MPRQKITRAIAAHEGESIKEKEGERPKEGDRESDSIMAGK